MIGGRVPTIRVTGKQIQSHWLRQVSFEFDSLACASCLYRARSSKTRPVRMENARVTNGAQRQRRARLSKAEVEARNMPIFRLRSGSDLHATLPRYEKSVAADDSSHPSSLQSKLRVAVVVGLLPHEKTCDPANPKRPQQDKLGSTTLVRGHQLLLLCRAGPSKGDDDGVFH